MSHIRVKTTYNVEGSYGSVEKRILYADHNNSCDVVNYYTENGEFLFSVEDTMDNNLLDAINRLFAPNKSNSRELSLDVEYMNVEDYNKCKI